MGRPLGGTSEGKCGKEEQEETRYARTKARGPLTCIAAVLLERRALIAAQSHHDMLPDPDLPNLTRPHAISATGLLFHPATYHTPGNIPLSRPKSEIWATERVGDMPTSRAPRPPTNTTSTRSTPAPPHMRRILASSGLDSRLLGSWGVGCSRIVGAGRQCCPTFALDGRRDWSACGVLVAPNQGPLGTDEDKSGRNVTTRVIRERRPRFRSIVASR